MPSKKSKKDPVIGKKKSKAQQLLISRFFTKAPQQPQEQPEKEPDAAHQSKKVTSTVDKEDQSRVVPSPLHDEGTKSSKNVLTATQVPSKTSDQGSDDTPRVSQNESNSVNTEMTAPNSKLETPTRGKESSDSNGSDTPATVVLRTPSSPRDTLPSSQSDDGEPPVSRKRRRLFIEDADSESDCERMKKKKSKGEDPDFEMSDDAEASNSDMSMDVVSEDDAEDQQIGDEPQKDQIASQPQTTLASYEFQRGKDTRVMPRNEKQRKRFTQKIGRLEKNSFFLRRTGGGGEKEEKEAAAKSKSVKYTPLESQYVKLRKQHPDKFLLVECGYKYRMFDEDAATASKVLRVASFFAHNFLTASFPTHRLAHHVRSLVSAGYKVGVISQSETAALKKASSKSSGLFERKLSAVYTKGTIAADGKLVGSATMGISIANTASYIMSIRELELGEESVSSKVSKLSIAAVDTASGDVVYDFFDNDELCSDLESRLVAIEPVEILMTRDMCSKMVEQVVKVYCETKSCRLERMAALSFNPDLVSSTLRSSVENRGSMTQISVELSLSCLGALVSYLKQFELELSMTAALEYKSFRSKREMRIGADVLRNFEVFGNSSNGGVEGSLSGLVNRTTTSFGSRQMRQWISHPLTNPTDIKKRLDVVEYLRDRVDETSGRHDDSQSLENATIDLIGSLAGLPDLERGLMRISCQRCTPAEFVNVITAMEEVGRKIDQIKSFSHSADFPTLLTTLFSSTPVVAKTLDCGEVQILNRGAALQNRLHELFEQEVPVSDLLEEEEGVSDFLDVLKELKDANDDLASAEKGMNKLLRKLRNQFSNPKWEWKKVGQDEYLLEVQSSKAGSMPRSWTVVCQTKVVKRFRPKEAEEGYERIQCSRETRDAVSGKCWISYLDMFSRITTSLRVVVRTLTDLDCLAALARVANMPGYAKPELDMDSTKPAGLYAEAARHPLTETLSSCVSYVPNDVKLGRATNEIAVVISGPNYGGKSSYARMTALIAILAQIGSYVPAKVMKLSPFDSIHARMGSSDSIAKGMSSLMVELAETSRILRTATPRSLVVLDELGRGTSTHDGSAIAYATLSHLVGSVKCSTLFVTHYPMLAGLRSSYPGLVTACFMNYRQESQKGSQPDEPKSKITFLYKLTEGVASSSYGLNVARLAGIPAHVIDLALTKACEMEDHVGEVKKESQWSHMLSEGTWGSESLAKQALVTLPKHVG